MNLLPVYNLIQFELDDNAVRILCLQSGQNVEITFCFSQLSLEFYLRQSQATNGTPSEKIIQNYIEWLEGRNFPKQHYLQEVSFDQFTSSMLMPGIEVLSQMADEKLLLKTLVRHFRESRFLRYRIPEKNPLTHLLDPESIPALPALYVDMELREVRIYFSKLQAGQLANELADREKAVNVEIIECISNSILPDANPKPIEYLYGLAAEVFGLLLSIGEYRVRLDF